MAEPRKLKKSESLEIRIPYPTKQAFMARCRAEGRSASEEMRRFIEGRLEPERPRAGRRMRQVIAAAVIAAAVGAGAAPALARAGAVTGFERLDADGDQRIALDEFRRLDIDGDGAVSLDEYRR